MRNIQSRKTVFGATAASMKSQVYVENGEKIGGSHQVLDPRPRGARRNAELWQRPNRQSRFGLISTLLSPAQRTSFVRLRDLNCKYRSRETRATFLLHLSATLHWIAE